MTCYSVLEVTPTDTDWIAGYLAPVGEIIEKHGGKYLARTASHERVEGEGDEVGLRVILEWPDRAAAKAFVTDPEYAPHLAARHAGSVSHHILIDGVDDLA